eukprot:Blabericola_migrator_1__4254@NODE_2300_length_2977_cov_37_403436_g399_i1_p3_GENE_NODE_2300_length_2977_cov_37_403436_g399_i1NODE_2300_length_2977_cov_37_403436_g399_i1_p3_ORF_typecomplete_len222_score20_31SYS1/PF09801_9/0_23_NODE_2300_length_2977_cov_37_403436_g399_i15471212
MGLLLCGAVNIGHFVAKVGSGRAESWWTGVTCRASHRSQTLTTCGSTIGTFELSGNWVAADTKKMIPSSFGTPAGCGFKSIILIATQLRHSNVTFYAVSLDSCESERASLLWEHLFDTSRCVSLIVSSGAQSLQWISDDSFTSLANKLICVGAGTLQWASLEWHWWALLIANIMMMKTMSQWKMIQVLRKVNCFHCNFIGIDSRQRAKHNKRLHNIEFGEQ